MKKLLESLKNKISSFEIKPGSSFKLLVTMALVLLVFVGVIAIAVFFVAVRGAEETLVPDVRGKELSEALLELQAKELYPRIQLRYSQSSRDKGQVLEQDPGAGTTVKAGRRIRLVVSQGVILNRIENYIGKNIDEVRIEIQTITASTGVQLITLKEPLIYDFSPEAPGTVLRQKPEANAGITGPTELELVLSRGLENPLTTVPKLTGLTLAAALEQIAKTGITFEFSIREIQERERGGTVVEQSPPEGTEIPPGTVNYLVVTIPTDLKDNEVFGLFTYNMPQNPYPLPVRLEAQPPTGDRIGIFGIEYQGGKFTVPYRLPVDSVLILTIMNNRELHRQTVKH
jgi:beta-lactam-binding protein with PASTA domain